MLNIFISYSSQNREAVEILAADLAEMGYAVWYDHELTGGHPWWTAILQSIRQCDVFVFAVTPASLSSIPCQREYEYAHALHKRILPVWLEDVDIRILPAPLQVIQVVDYRERTPAAILKLTRACIQLPPAQPLPDKMPPEPEVPLSPLAYAAERVNGPTLDLDKQRLLVSDLRELLADPSTAQSARQLLEKFAAREDLFAKVEKELAGYIDNQPPAVSFPKSLPPPPLPTISYPRSLMFKAPVESVRSIAFSPDGQHLLTGSGIPRLWDAVSGELIRVFWGHSKDVMSCLFSHNGRWIVTSSFDGTVRIWDVQSGQEKQLFERHNGIVWTAEFSPDDDLVLTAGEDKTIMLFDASTSDLVRLFTGHNDRVYFAHHIPQTQMIISGSVDKTLRLWDLQTGREVKMVSDFRYPVFHAAVNARNHYAFVATSGGELSLWDVSRLKMLTSVSPTSQFGSAFSPDGNWVVTGTDGGVRLWNVASLQLAATFSDLPGRVDTVAFSPNGRAVAGASWKDGTARLWSLDGII